MVGARDANLKGAARVHKAALIFARHMEEGRDAIGATLGQNLAEVMVLVTRLLGGRLDSVHLTVPWCRTTGFMGVTLWELWSRIQNLACLKSSKRLSLLTLMNVDIMKMDSSFVTSAGYPGFEWEHFGLQQAHLPVGVGGPSSVPVLVPEGRVHGGSLMSMLAGTSGLGLSSGKSMITGPSKPGKLHSMPHNWIGLLFRLERILEAVGNMIKLALGYVYTVLTRSLE
ncbi:hypothetical protein F0562_013170 [Nyssa sinensis]|uniref:Uncharacterized protein n=1 Tax=Nyssa sinensis TaxID=561372 RepID=A0A5J4ZWI7_9ASTE|nr:hypothetical protein F0562_013170 [Nyssa sinensis]